MSTRKFVSFIATALVGVGLVTIPATAAQAAPVAWSYAASTGGTYVKVLDGTVNSDFTAQSFITGGPTGTIAKNSTAAANVAGLVSVGAVQTETEATVTADTTTLRSFARTANVSLLGGLITVDAVETNISTVGKTADGTGSATGGTQLAGIKIAGINLPLDIPKNYSVTIPGIATVSMNFLLHGKVDKTVVTMGWALGVTLLQPREGYAAGATVLLNPVNQYLAETPPATGAALYGEAYGTRVEAHVGSNIQVVSDRTAFIGTPYGSSEGQTLQNQTLGVNVPGVLTTGVVTSTTKSSKDALGNAEILNTNQTAGLNLLGGLITADAIKVSAYGKVQDGKYTSVMEMTTVNLVVAGQKIPINVSPNTVIDVAGLGSVSINLQRKNPYGAPQNRIDGIRIVLDTARAGLPVGAVIEIGVAGTFIG